MSKKHKSYHDIILYNPFHKPVEIQLLLEPKNFIDIKQVKTIIQEENKRSHEQYQDKVVCIANKHMSKETL